MFETTNCPWLEGIEGKVLFDEPLARYTTWKTGGKADVIYVTKHIKDFQHFFKSLPAKQVIHFLGLGSNTLVLDGGVRGVVIVMQGSGLSQFELLEDNCVKVEAGVACGQFARLCARAGLANAEFMAGIPGTIGGALAMNAGCYGSETWEFVTTVETIDRQGNLHIRKKSEFDIAYRHVLGKKDEYFVGATFQFVKGDKAIALAKIKDLLAKRNASQPTNYPNCGSVFRNPPGDHAARLIECCGLKGLKQGNAQISEKHANFIVNLGGASSRDILMLIEKAQSEVKSQAGVELIREAKIVGEM